MELTLNLKGQNTKTVSNTAQYSSQPPKIPLSLQTEIERARAELAAIEKEIEEARIAKEERLKNMPPPEVPVEFPSQIRPLPPNQLQRNEEELRKYLAMENAEDTDQLPRNM